MIIYLNLAWDPGSVFTWNQQELNISDVTLLSFYIPVRMTFPDQCYLLGAKIIIYLFLVSMFLFSLAYVEYVASWVKTTACSSTYESFMRLNVHFIMWQELE